MKSSKKVLTDHIEAGYTDKENELMKKISRELTHALMFATTSMGERQQDLGTSRNVIHLGIFNGIANYVGNLTGHFYTNPEEHITSMMEQAKEVALTHSIGCCENEKKTH